MKEQQKGPRRFPRERVIPKEQEWSSAKVFDEVYGYITRKIRFTYDWQPVVVTLWTLGTYLHRNFPCYGHLWLNSPTTHSGKTKLLNVLHSLCYRAIEPQLEPSAAVLFRFPSAIGGTLLLDEIDKLDPNRRSDVISILNHYYANGSVTRATQGRKKKFELERFPVYCPKVIAGIEGLPPTLQDRCVRIVLHRKKKSEMVERFLPEDYHRMEPLRGQLDAWCGRKGLEILRAYRERKGLGVPSGVDDDRVRDILEPLFAIACVLPKRIRDLLRKGALSVCRDRKDEQADSDPVVAGIQVLRDHFPKGKDVWPLRSEAAIGLLGEIPGLEDKAAVQKLLRKLGFRSTTNRVGPKVLRAYRITAKRLEHLARHYGGV